MEQNDLLTINLSKQDIEDFKSFCKLNEITDEEVYLMLLKGNLKKKLLKKL